MNGLSQQSLTLGDVLYKNGPEARKEGDWVSAFLLPGIVD